MDYELPTTNFVMVMTIDDQQITLSAFSYLTLIVNR